MKVTSKMPKGNTRKFLLKKINPSLNKNTLEIIKINKNKMSNSRKNNNICNKKINSRIK